MTSALTLVWLRRDLRLFDNTALQTAIRHGLPVVAVFVFDTAILQHLPPHDRRLTFIHECVAELQQQLAAHDVPLLVLHGDAQTEIPAFASRIQAARVVCAEDYEPQAIARDAAVAQQLERSGIAWQAVTDQVMLPKSSVMTLQGKPYSVFTPYKKAWLALAAERYAHGQPADDWAALAQVQTGLPPQWRQIQAMPTLADIGFERQTLLQSGGETAAQAALADFMARMHYYADLRDFPANKGVSYLSAHLRFGTLSIRHLVYLARQADNAGAAVWLSELIWREFYQQFLYHHPHVVNESFQVQYRHLAWENNPAWFARWQNGTTGYPIVDAAMRQLSSSGYMHNRLRMVAASFLVKDLLIDWRWGEAWFAQQLLDFDLAANNGGWQWAASTGCDAQPYFRIFNPVAQSQKFDANGHFIRRYVPELAHLDSKTIHAPWTAKHPVDTRGYPPPLVDHAVQREKALALFKKRG